MIRLKDLLIESTQLTENWKDGDVITFNKSLGGIFRKLDSNYWPSKGESFKLKKFQNNEFELIPVGNVKPETREKSKNDGIGFTTNQLNKFSKKGIINRE